MLNFVKCLFCKDGDNHMIFLLNSFNMMNINGLSNNILAFL